MCTWQWTVPNTYNCTASAEVFIVWVCRGACHRLGECTLGTSHPAVSVAVFSRIPIPAWTLRITFTLLSALRPASLLHSAMPPLGFLSDVSPSLLADFHSPWPLAWSSGSELRGVAHPELWRLVLGLVPVLSCWAVWLYLLTLRRFYFCLALFSPESSFMITSHPPSLTAFRVSLSLVFRNL